MFNMWYKLASLLFIAMSFYASTQTKITDLIRQIPDSEQRDLERFFQFLITRETLGYTLFGDKPISCATYLSLENSDGTNTTKYLILEKGWQAWLRNRSLISEKHFALKRKSSEKILSIYLINKKKTLEMISENLDEFRFLGSMDPQEILEKICSEETQNNPIKTVSLLGIFFGYGKKNSQSFECEANHMQALSSKMAPPFSSDKIASKLIPEARALVRPLAKRRKFGAPRSGLTQNDINEFNHLAHRRKTFVLKEEFFFLPQFASPSFVCWDEEEAEQLKASFNKTQFRMKETYQTGSFLEKTLQQWIMPQ